MNQTTKCFENILDERGGVRQVFLNRIIAGDVDSSDYANYISSVVGKYQDNDIDLITEYLSSEIAIANEYISSAGDFHLLTIDQFLPEKESEFEDEKGVSISVLAEEGQQSQTLLLTDAQIFEQKMNANRTSERSIEDMNTIELNSEDDLISAFGNNSEYMTLFVNRFSNDVLDRIVLSSITDSNGNVIPVFNVSIDDISKSIGNFALFQGKSKEELIAFINAEKIKYSSASDYFTDLTSGKNGDKDIYKAFVALNFDKLLSITQNTFIQKKNGKYVYAVEGKMRTGWSDNEFVDVASEVTDFAKQLINSRPMFNIKGERMRTYLDIKGVNHVVGKLRPLISNASYNDSLLEVTKQLINAKKTGNTESLSRDFKHIYNQLTGADFNVLSTLYETILKTDESTGYISFKQRFNNSYANLSIRSKSVDPYNTVLSTIMKTVPLSYVQQEFDYQENRFTRDNIGSSMTNARRRQIESSILSQSLISDILAELFSNQAGVELDKVVRLRGGKGDVSRLLFKDGSAIDFGDSSNNIGGDAKIFIDTYFKHTFMDGMELNKDDMQDFMTSLQTSDDVDNIINSVVISALRAAYLGDDIKKAKYMAQTSRYISYLSGDSIRSVMKSLNNTSLPTSGIINMIGSFNTRVDFIKKHTDESSPIRNNFSVKYSDRFGNPETETFIKFRDNIIPVAKADANDIFYNKFVLRYLDGIANGNYKIAIQPTAYSDKTKQTSVVFYGKDVLDTMSSNDKFEFMVDTLWHDIDSYGKTLVSDMNKMFGTNLLTVSDVQNYINKENLTGSQILNAANNAGVYIVSSTVFDKLKAKEKAEVNDILLSCDRSLFKQFLTDQLNDAAKEANEAFCVNFDEIDSSIIQKILSAKNINHTVFTNSFRSKDGRMLMVAGSGEINPLFKEFFMDSNIIGMSYQAATVGTVLGHAPKGYNGGSVRHNPTKLKENIAARYVGMTKRMIAHQATFHPFVMGMYNGVSYYDSVAFVADPEYKLFNMLGDTGGIDSSDGASISLLSSRVQKNNSLVDQGGQMMQKSIVMGADPVTGAALLTKHADHTITNEMIRQSHGARMNLGVITKKMLDRKFEENIDLSRAYNGTNMANLIDSYQQLDGVIYKLTNITNEGNGIYRFDYDPQNNAKAQSGSSTHKIESLYDLYVALGGEYSLGYDAHGHFGLSENSFYNLAEFIASVGHEKSKDGLHDYMSNNPGKTYEQLRGEISREVYNKDDASIEHSISKDGLSQDTLFQPLRKYHVGQIIFTSAQKVGIINPNSDQVLHDDSTPFMIYDRYSNLFGGLQLDHEHHTDDSELTEATQVFTSLFFNGDDVHNTNQLSQSTAMYIKANLKQYFMGSYGNPAAESLFDSIVSATITREIGRKSDMFTMASAIAANIDKKYSDLKKEKQRLESNGKQEEADKINTSIEFFNNNPIPISAASVHKVFVNSMANLMTRLGVRRKHPGGANVIGISTGFLSIKTLADGSVAVGDQDTSEITRTPASINNIEMFDIVEDSMGNVINVDSVSKYRKVLDGLLKGESYNKLFGYGRDLLPNYIRFTTIDDNGLEHNQNNLNLASTRIFTNISEINSYNASAKEADVMFNEIELYFELLLDKYKIFDSNDDNGFGVKKRKEYVDKMKGEIDLARARFAEKEEKPFKIKEFKQLLKNLSIKESSDIDNGYYSLSLDDLVRSGKIKSFKFTKKDIKTIKDSFKNPVKISNVDHRGSETVMPAHMAAKFMITSHDQPVNMSADIYNNRLKEIRDKAINVPFEFNTALIESDGNHIYHVNDDYIDNIIAEGKAKLSYMYENNTIVDRDGYPISNITKTRVYEIKVPIPGRKSFKTLRVIKGSDVDVEKFFKSFNDNKNHFRYITSKDESFDELNRLEYSSLLYESFKAHLEGMTARIPAQSKQSGSAIKIVGFLHNQHNVQYISPYLLWLTGGDLDIDKTNTTQFLIDNRGLFVEHSTLFSRRTRDHIVESLKLPIPNGVKLEKGFDDLFSDEEQKLLIKGLNDISSIDSNIDDFKTFINLLNKISDRKAIDSSNPDLIDAVNNYFTQEMNPDGYLSAIIYNMYNGFKSSKNLIHTYAPMEIEATKDVAKKSPKGAKVKNLSPYNPNTDIGMQGANMVGRDGIAIAATGLKALGVIIDRYTKIGVDKEQDKFLEFKSSINMDVCSAIGAENANPEFMIDGYDKTLTIDFVKEFISNQLESNLFLKGEDGKNEFLDNIVEYIYAKETDKSLDFSELLTCSTDNAKELVLEKINASIDTLGMYLYALTVGVSMKNVATFMTNPIVDVILSNSKGSIVDASSRGQTIDKSIEEVLNGYKSLSYLGIREQAILDYLKDAYEAHYLKPYSNEGKKSTQEQIQHLVEILTIDMLPDSGISYVTASEEELEIMGDLDEYAPTESAKKSIIYQWFFNSKKLSNSIKQASPNNDYKKVVELFKKIKLQSTGLKALGQVLGINQSVKSDEYSFYKYERVLKKYYYSRVSSKFSETEFETKKGKEELQKYYSGFSFDLMKFLQDKDYQDLICTQYADLTSQSEPNIFEVIRSSEHFMEMISLVSVLKNDVYNKSAKSRIMNNIVSAVDFDRIFGLADKDLGFPKQMVETTFNAMSDIAGDAIIVEFLDSLDIIGYKASYNAGDKIPTQTGSVSMEDYGLFDLSDYDGRRRFTSWFERKILEMKHDPDLQSNMFIKNIIIDSDIDKINGDEIRYAKPSVQPSSNNSPIEAETYAQMKTSLQELRNSGRMIGDNKFYDLLFMYNLIVNRDKSSSKSFSQIISDTFDANDDNFIGNKFNRFVADMDKDVNYTPHVDVVNECKSRLIGERAYSTPQKDNGMGMQFVQKFNSATNTVSRVYYYNGHEVIGSTSKSADVLKGNKNISFKSPVVNVNMNLSSVIGKLKSIIKDLNIGENIQIIC